MSARNHILLLVLVPLIVLFVAASFYRFVIANDYIVAYEADCDPAIESCYLGCEDDACEEPYPYKEVRRYASAARNACGPDITDCDAAGSCNVGEGGCSIEYCDPDALGEGEECFEVIEEEPVEEETGTDSEEVDTPEEL